MEILKVGNAQGFWGDRPDAAAELLFQQRDLHYLTLDYLAELSLSIMAIQREKKSELGYARDFVDVVASLIPFWNSGSQTKVITNAGGLNPKSCLKACLEACRGTLKRPLKFAIVTGDDVLEYFSEDLITANAYLGADPIVEALKKGADIVITGRVADPSLTVAPFIHHYKCRESDALAGATVAGHLIECGTQVTGGVSSHWLEVQNPQVMGFPIAEIYVDGSCTITKPAASGGEVTERTVKEQLLYEVLDPGCYLSPDITVSFNDIEVIQEAENRVSVKGAKGSKPTDSYKVNATSRAGYRAEALLGVFGSQARQKAEKSGEMIMKRVGPLDRYRIECLGAGAIVPGVIENADSHECLLRVVVSDSDRAKVEKFTKEVAPLITSGPQGITGYTTGRPKVRPQFRFSPKQIKKEKVRWSVEVHEVGHEA